MSVSASETYILQFNHDDFLHILADAFGSIDAAPEAAPTSSDAGRDELKLDAIKAYTEKMGKYRRDVRTATSNSLFFHALKISHAAKAPFDHMLCFLQSRLKEPATTSHLSLLVGGKASELAKEFEDGLSDLKWADVAATTSLGNTSSP